jgi:hypothetical protein
VNLVDPGSFLQLWAGDKKGIDSSISSVSGNNCVGHLLKLHRTQIFRDFPGRPLVAPIYLSRTSNCIGTWVGERVAMSRVYLYMVSKNNAMSIPSTVR